MWNAHLDKAKKFWFLGQLVNSATYMSFKRHRSLYTMMLTENGNTVILSHYTNYV